MPPKKSKEKLLWAECNKCGYVVPSVTLNDPCTGFGIKENAFFTNKINKNESKALDNINTVYTERYVLIHPALAILCFINMNSDILVEFTPEIKFVKKAWISGNDKEVGQVYTTSKEILQIVRYIANPRIVIKPFNGKPRIASKLILKGNRHIQDTKELQRIILAKIKDTILHPSNIITVNFLNQEFDFTIQQTFYREKPDLAEQLALLFLLSERDVFYLVESTTVVQIKNEDDHAFSDHDQRIILDDIGGLNDVYKDLTETMGYAFSSNDPKAIRGVLLHGLAGVGKTMIAEAVVKFKPSKEIKIDSFKVFSKYQGESEENLKKLFNEAFQLYPQTSVIIIDEIANICPKNDNSDVVRRVSSLLISLIEKVHQTVNGSKIFIIATTSNLDNVNPALRRSGRLDYEIEIPVPNEEMRREIIAKKVRGLPKFNIEIINKLAKLTYGYVGADLEKLIEKSKLNIKDKKEFVPNLVFENLTAVKPSAMREMLIDKPNVKWTDIGGMEDLKLKLKQIIEWPTEHPEVFTRLGIKPPSGLLMFGAPGNSKTMIAKAIATECHLNFISIKGSDLFSMWVGESEKAVRDLFIKARQLSPCVVFFDEIDAIGGEREKGSSVKERVLAQILTEMDGVNTLKNVIIIAATNRPDLIDPALMRPGRLDRIIYVKLPDRETRLAIFNVKLKNIQIHSDVNPEELANRTEGYSGAEIEAVVKEAGLKALGDDLNAAEISMNHFLHALDVIKPRTSPELLKIYEDYENRQ